jgi:DNA-binding GntR family transcriptional regulator
MTDADVAELAGYLEGMRAAARADDGHGVAEADARFHGRIVELADNGTLEKVWRSLEPFSRTYITLVVPGADPQWSANLHAPILAAIERRDTEAVVDAIRRHFDEVSENMTRRWPDEPPEAANPPRSRRNA